jgi:hypothetical protein
MDILSIFASGVVSIVIALVIQLWWERRTAIRNMKIDCLRCIAAHRSAPATKEFAAALNEVVVTFNDSPKVIGKMKLFLQNARTGAATDDQMLDIMRAMMDNLGLKYASIGDSGMLSKIESI